MNQRELDKLLDLLKPVQPAPVPEMRLYYDDQGRVITYTCENLPGKYIVVSPQVFAEARPDVLVKDGQVVYTHKVSHVHKLVKNASTGIRTSKYDVNVLDPEGPEFAYWKPEIYEIK